MQNSEKAHSDINSLYDLLKRCDTALPEDIKIGNPLDKTNSRANSSFWCVKKGVLFFWDSSFSINGAPDLKQIEWHPRCFSGYSQGERCSNGKSLISLLMQDFQVKLNGSLTFRNSTCDFLWCSLSFYHPSCLDSKSKLYLPLQLQELSKSFRVGLCDDKYVLDLAAPAFSQKPLFLGSVVLYC